MLLTALINISILYTFFSLFLLLSQINEESFGKKIIAFIYLEFGMFSFLRSFSVYQSRVFIHKILIKLFRQIIYFDIQTWLFQRDQCTFEKHDNFVRKNMSMFIYKELMKNSQKSVHHRQSQNFFYNKKKMARKLHESQSFFLFSTILFIDLNYQQISNSFWKFAKYDVFMWTQK